MAGAPSAKKKQKKGDELSDLKILGQQLLTSRAHVNNLSHLLKFISVDSPPQFVLECLLSLQSFFTPLVPQLPASSSSEPPKTHPDPEFKYRTWLRSKFDDFMLRLTNVVVASECEDALREVVLDAIMEFVKVGHAGKFHSAIYHRLLDVLVHSTISSDDVLFDLLVAKYFNYIDVCYFTYISLGKLARTLEGKEDKSLCSDGKDGIQTQSSMELSVRKIHNLLSQMPSLEDSEKELNIWSASGVFPGKSNDKECVDLEDKQRKSQGAKNKVLPHRSIWKKMKLKFTKAWISFLRLPLPLDVYKEVLVSLHQDVIPYLSNPIMLCDFLTRTYDIGNVVSVMALSSLFILMTQHGLEYPNFYDKLYALLEPSIFLAKHRAKFFQLLDACLKSSLLPAYMVAAFCKKLGRLALFVPPSGALVIVALVHNLLLRHPSISFLVHREGGTETTTETSEDNGIANQETSQDKAGIDYFNNEENNPKDANAMRSSLWEIESLRHHYCPAVSRFVLSMENDLAFRTRTPEIAIKDFCHGSYATIFNAEERPRVRQVPLAFYKATPTHLFSESDFEGWTFKPEAEESVNVIDGGETTVKSEKRKRTAR
ncbi:protein NUCLEOLAR COMPLEX ASSOCIATED 4 isoform X2 [Andrographis paniculata]|uniref:protein NUCLEOLAR COMPLEX ASSOCIATED 4 isoform X2 n=1 Tax=Andrographis paniculata TaxID=175694 RepID=UPI0021E85C5B|nr:protein NUCLEOLAR COMPLEX ASSOCIATED 4 isoform X2 [Andrographis paniculata]